MKEKTNKSLTVSKRLKKGFKKFLSDESGQGMTEYVFVLLILVAVLAIFRTQITEAFTSRIGNLADLITNFTGDGG